MEALADLLKGNSWGLLDEINFNSWYQGVAKQYGLNPDPNDPKHHYDYRLAYKLGVREPTYQPEHGQYRWPDIGKEKDYNKYYEGR